MRVTVNIGDDDQVKEIRPGAEIQFGLPLRYIVEDGDNLDIYVKVETGENAPRSLTDILTDAIEHGRANPDHGTNCACIDPLLAEMRGQIMGLLPTSEVEPDWKKRIDARSRVSYLLRTVVRTL